MSRISDVETTARIKLAMIANPGIGGLEIGVDTVNGIVFLRGFVQDPEQKGLAEDIARQHGGLDIKNDIEVLGEPVGEVEARATEAAFWPSGEDDLLRQRVEGDLESDQRVNAVMVNVEVLDGVVYLSGLQDDPEARKRVEEIARRTPGVRDVVNEIDVRRAA